MKQWVTLVLLLAAQAASAQQVDTNLVGMWQLQWLGPQMLWQVRADGTYRLIGVGARPNEHWGRMQASGGKWASEWERGKDGGSYQLQGSNWTVTGALGTGTWARIWPSAQVASRASCPYIDVAVVERLFASAVSGRMIQTTCELSAIKPGITDGVSIDSELIDRNQDTLRIFRGNCANGTNTDPKIRCVPGLGETAFFMYGKLYAYQGNRRISIALGTYPENNAVKDADSITLAKVVLSHP
jgi:hypothetical protein